MAKTRPVVKEILEVIATIKQKDTRAQLVTLIQEMTQEYYLYPKGDIIETAPCVKCGRKRIAIKEMKVFDDTLYYRECNCGNKGAYGHSKEEALQNWNLGNKGE